MSQRRTVVSDWPGDSENPVKAVHPNHEHTIHPCPQLPGTLLRVYIPPGAVINLLNLIELSSPGGICLILRIPILGGETTWSALTEAIKQAGGSLEVVTE